MNEFLIKQAVNLIEKPVFYPVYILYMHTKYVMHLIAQNICTKTHPY